MIGNQLTGQGDVPSNAQHGPLARRVSLGEATKLSFKMIA